MNAVEGAEAIQGRPSGGFFSRDRGPAWALVLLCAFVLLPAMGTSDFWAPDEPEFALIARTMAERGDWIVPFQNGHWYAEKPPLLYWAVLLSTGGGRAFEGEAPFAPFLARLPSALAAAALVLGLYAFLKGRHGRRAAFLSAGVLALSARFALQARTVQTDMLFTAATAGAAMLFLAAERGEGRRPSAGILTAAWGVLGLSVLAKGPLGPVLVGTALAAHLALQPGERVLRALRTPAHLAGIAVLAAVTVPWYLLVLRRLGPVEGPEFLRQNLVVQNLGRTVDSYSHARPPWTYLLTLPVDSLPWTPVLAAGLVRLWGKAARGRDPESRMLLAWALPAFLLLCLVSSKQGKYLLPIFPPMAAAAGLWLDAAAGGAAGPRAVRWTLGIPAGVLAAAGAALLAAGAAPRLLPVEIPPAALLVPGGLLAAGGGAALAALRRGGDPLQAVRRIGAAQAFAFAAAGLLVLPALDPAKSARRFCEEVARKVPAGAALVQFGSFRSAYPYFLRREIPVVGDGWSEGDRRAMEELRAFLALPGRGFVIVQEGFWNGFGPAAKSLFDPRPLAARAVGGSPMLLLAER